MGQFFDRFCYTLHWGTGWTQRTWDSHSSRPMTQTKWDDLPAHGRRNAELLGFRSDVCVSKRCARPSAAIFGKPDALTYGPVQQVG